MASSGAAFGISMDGRAPIADIPAQARAAEEGGASTLWIACHLYLRDPVTMAALALGATRKLKIALMAMSPYSTHPVYIAMAAASLDEMYPGRVILCLGSGAPADLKAAGIESPKPLVAIGEAARICRSLFKGEMTDFQGQMFKVAGRRLANGGRDIPIVVAASRPNMLKLAGRETDGVLISAEDGQAVAYALWKLQERGRMFVSPGDKLYEGMIVGIHSRDNDLVVNAVRQKQLTNFRVSGKEDAIKITPPIELTLEYAVEFIEDDELVEITPKSIRLRKRHLKEHERKRAGREG